MVFGIKKCGMLSVRFQVENLPPVLDLLFDFLESFELNPYPNGDRVVLDALL